jgi:hypothetical protein
MFTVQEPLQVACDKLIFHQLAGLSLKKILQFHLLSKLCSCGPVGGIARCFVNNTKEKIVNYQNNARTMVGIAMTLALLGTSSTAFADYENVGNKSYTQICPQHIGGDREYDGHGPGTTTNVELFRSGERSVQVKLYMHQVETVSDWSEAELNRTFTLGTLPSKATHYWATNSQGAWGWKAIPASLVFDVWESYFVDNSHSVRTFNNPDWWITQARINGDTGGLDIGNCTSDDAYLSVYFNSIYVMY